MSGWTNWQILVYLLSNVFYSKLKQCNVLDVEYEIHEKLLRQGLNPSTALKKFKMQTIPKTGIEIERISTYVGWWEMEYLSVFFKVVEQQRCCSNISSYSVHDENLARPAYRHDEVEINTASSWKQISSSIYIIQIFPFIEKDKEYDNYIREWLTGDNR